MEIAKAPAQPDDLRETIESEGEDEMYVVRVDKVPTVSDGQELQNS